VIAEVLFSRFDRSDLLAPEPARRYRRLILERGGSAPAARLVKIFWAGRSRNWLETGG
jgi:thimet oligopeptidase